jgi:hypothetical protein
MPLLQPVIRVFCTPFVPRSHLPGRASFSPVASTGAPRTGLRGGEPALSEIERGFWLNVSASTVAGNFAAAPSAQHEGPIQPGMDQSQGTSLSVLGSAVGVALVFRASYTPGGTPADTGCLELLPLLLLRVLCAGTLRRSKLSVLRAFIVGTLLDPQTTAEALNWPGLRRVRWQPLLISRHSPLLHNFFARNAAPPNSNVILALHTQSLDTHRTTSGRLVT